MRAFEDVVFSQQRKLFLVKNMVLSIDDWKWPCRCKDMPIQQVLPSDHGVGWMADNVVACIFQFIVMSRKRWKKASGAKAVLESNSDGLLACARALAQERVPDLTIVCDRGYTTLETFAKRALCVHGVRGRWCLAVCDHHTVMCVCDVGDVGVWYGLPCQSWNSSFMCWASLITSATILSWRTKPMTWHTMTERQEDATHLACLCF